MPGRDERIAAIDMVKGVAIAWVMMIHARVLDGSAWMEHLVGDAVPVFVVIFGLNAESWWARQDRSSAAAWWVRSLRRLLVPLWAMLACWWAGDLLVRRVVAPSWPLVLGNLAGWLPNVGTGWFVTLAVQLVVAWPFLHAVVRRLDDRRLLVAAILWVVASADLLPAVLATMGKTCYVLFAPARFGGHALAGAWLARRLADMLDPRFALASFASWCVAVLLQEAPLPPAAVACAARAAEVLLAAWLLGAMHALRDVASIERPLLSLPIPSPMRIG
ncbi:MAG: acyltransferase family protein [Alphaproteobacteria bacterium]